MPNRTVIVRLGVDSTAAVTGLRRVVSEAKSTAAGIKSNLGSATSSVDKVGSSTGKLGGGFKALGVAGAAGFAAVGAGAIGLGVGLGKSISKAANFEDSMRQVGKQAGLSGDALKGMTDLALEMGAKTSFSAQGASDAMLELAKGGLSAAEIRAGALEQTLTLATAGGLELGAAAGYMTQGLNTFNLKASDSGRVAAALAGGANASTASVEDLGTALSQVGPGAALLGLSIEDTTAALAAFTNNGMKGSDAGTSLKTMLNSLQPTTVGAANALRDMGIITEDDTNKFFTATGELRSMEEVSGLLQKGLEGQTKAQQAATLETIFGSDAYRAAAILAKEGASGIAEYVKATSDSGAAAELAQSATEGYSGALERFKGSIETAQIQLGRKFLPILTEVLDYLSGPGITTFSDLAGIIRDTFAPQIDKTTGGITKFFNYLSTHQADVIETFQSWGNGVFDFAVAVAKMSAGGLRSFAKFTVGATEGLLNFIGTGIDGLVSLAEPFNRILTIAKLVNPAFAAIDPIDLTESKTQFEQLRESAIKGAEDSSDSLNGLADGIDRNVIPSVEKMRGRFNDASNQQIIKATQRDQVAQFDQALKGLTKATEGSTRTTKDNSATLDKNTERGRTNRAAVEKAIGAANTKARSDFEATLKAKGLSAATKESSERMKTNKEKLREAAAAAGFNKREVDKMIDKMLDTPKKIETKVTTPGLKTADRAVGDFDTQVNNLNNKSITITARFGVTGSKAVADLNKNIVGKYGKGGRQIALATGGSVWGQGTATSDSIPAMLSNGEEVIRTYAAEKTRPVLKFINREGRAPTDQERMHLADGGTVKRKLNARTQHSMRKISSDPFKGSFAAFEDSATQYMRDLAQNYVQALSQALNSGDYSTAAAGKYGDANFTSEQLRNAATIASVGSPMGKKAVLIGLITAMQESGLRNINYGDRDSVGLFQQRAPWGSFSDRTNPRVSAGMFYHGGKGGQRGLDDIKGWQGMEPGRAAQAVQVSAFPGAYRQWKNEATDIIGAMQQGGPDSGGGAAKGSGRQAIYNAMKRLGGNPVFTYAGHQPSANKAWDAMIQNMTEGDRIAGHLKANARQYGVQYLIWNRRIWNIERNQEGWRRYFDGGSSDPSRAHTNHVHVSHYKKGGTVGPTADLKPTKYDQGGQLPPGITNVYNGTRKPEHVVTDARWQQLINSRSAPARIDSGDMARLVEAINRIDGGNYTFNNPLPEPASRSVAKRSLYASRG